MPKDAATRQNKIAAHNGRYWRKSHADTRHPPPWSTTMIVEPTRKMGCEFIASISAFRDCISINASYSDVPNGGHLSGPSTSSCDFVDDMCQIIQVNSDIPSFDRPLPTPRFYQPLLGHPTSISVCLCVGMRSVEHQSVDLSRITPMAPLYHFCPGKRPIGRSSVSVCASPNPGRSCGNPFGVVGQSRYRLAPMPVSRRFRDRSWEESK